MTTPRERSTRRPVGGPLRPGFSLVEVIVASVILGAALLSMAGFTVKYQQIDASTRFIVRAQQAANERLERVRAAQPYLSLDTMQTVESTIVGLPGYMRTTTVTHIGGSAADTVDYRVITVQVRTPGVARYVTKTSIVGAF